MKFIQKLYFAGNTLQAIEKYKEGLLIGSACVKGNVFELALRRSKAELIEEMKYYDYIEVQPPTAYRQLFNDMPKCVK